VTRAGGGLGGRCRQAVERFEAEWGLGGGRCRVGLHVRVPMFDWERAQVPSPHPRNARAGRPLAPRESRYRLARASPMSPARPGPPGPKGGTH
jgi:hypothetical protein